MDEGLTEEQYHILREKGTEAPFSGKYWDCKQAGTYVCAGCGNPLFSSDDKYDSGTGWPSFTRAIQESACNTEKGGHRLEVLCQKCAGHLGHIFEDGPAPDGNRFCINSGALKLV